MDKVKKTAKWYRSVLAKCDVRTGLSLIPEIIKKFGFATKYRSEINFSRDMVHKNFNCDHAIEGFSLEKGKVYAKVYWQGDSTDGTYYEPADDLIFGKVIPAEHEWLGDRTYYKHGDLRIRPEELADAIKAIIPELSTDLIRARKKYAENEPFTMPMYGRINRWKERAHPYNKWGGDSYQEKHNNGESAIRELVIPEAKKYMKMEDSALHAIFAKVYDLNYKTNEEMPKDAEGNKVYTFPEMD